MLMYLVNQVENRSCPVSTLKMKIETPRSELIELIGLHVDGRTNLRRNCVTTGNHNAERVSHLDKP